MINKEHPLYLDDLKYILQVKDFELLHSKRFMITGATGLIGTCLIDSLMQANHNGAGIEIFAIGRSKEKAADRLGEYFSDSLFHFIEQDARQPLPSQKVDYIIPLASNTHPLAYSQYPIETIEINIKGTEHALQKADECGATVLYPSTVEVYGNARGEDLFTEDYTGKLNLANARSCYPESKRLSEALCQSYAAQKGVNVKIARLSRSFGPTMLLSDSKASSQFILKALNAEDIVLKSKGNQFFSYTYVADIVSAMLHILIHGETATPYNISNDNCNLHLKDFASLCARWADKQVIFELPSEVENKGYSIAMTAILTNDNLKSLGWIGRYSAEEAINRTLTIMSDK